MEKLEKFWDSCCFSTQLTTTGQTKSEKQKFDVFLFAKMWEDWLSILVSIKRQKEEWKLEKITKLRFLSMYKCGTITCLQNSCSGARFLKSCTKGWFWEARFRSVYSDRLQENARSLKGRNSWDQCCSRDLSKTFPRPQYLLRFWNCQVHKNSNYRGWFEHWKLINYYFVDT